MMRRGIGSVGKMFQSVVERRVEIVVVVVVAAPEAAAAAEG